MNYDRITTTLGFGDVRLSRSALYPDGLSTAGQAVLEPRPALAPTNRHLYGMTVSCSTLLPVVGGHHAANSNSRLVGTVEAPPCLEQLAAYRIPAGFWLDPAVQAQLASTVGVQIYVCGTYALADLRRQLAATLYKVGTTSRASPLQRIEELRETQYACMRMDAEGNWYGEAGYENWILVPPPREMKVSSGSCVTILQDSIAVRLPRSMAAPEFEARFATRLAPFSLAAWAASDRTKRALQARGVDPGCALRGTRDREELAVIREVREIYALRVHRDFDALVAVAEDIVRSAISSYR